MKNKIRHLILGVLFISCVIGIAQSQDEGRIVFTDPKSKDEKVLSEDDIKPRVHASGVDVMLGNDGFGIGFFYNRILSSALAGFVSLSFSEALDERQVDYYDYWGGQHAINKINRVFRIPLFLGVQYRLFKDDIVDNFRPFVNGGIGPVMLYITSTEREFFSSLAYGHTEYSYGGFMGAGAHFGFDRSSVLGINLRYFIIPIPSGIRSVVEGDLPNANGFFITVNLGIAF